MDDRRLLNECPTVIGMMTSILQSGGSIDYAIREVAKEGPKNSKELFEDIVRRTDSKDYPSLVEGLSTRLNELPKESSGYSRSMLMVISASESSDKDVCERMLRDAAETALESVKEMGESYGSSLLIPCMIVFGIGIMIPMILMSILPMLNVGGMFGSNMINQDLVMVITLVMIPVGILMMTLILRNRNPFLSDHHIQVDIRLLILLTLSIPIALIHLWVGGELRWVFLFSVAPVCILIVMLMIEDVKDENRRLKSEQSLMGTIFDIGNRMVSGTNFETATIEAMHANDSCRHLSESLSREYSLCRGEVHNAIDNSISSTSKEMTLALRNILTCSEKDSNDAGRLAITLGRQFQNRNITLRNLENKLKSTKDMMVATAMLFAPLVLGMSVAMLEPLSRIGGNVSLEGTTLILSWYLVELSALIAILVSSLGNGENGNRMLWRFCTLCPISLLVFTICGMMNL